MKRRILAIHGFVSICIGVLMIYADTLFDIQSALYAFGYITLTIWLPLIFFVWRHDTPMDPPDRWDQHLKNEERKGL